MDKDLCLGKGYSCMATWGAPHTPGSLLAFLCPSLLSLLSLSLNIFPKAQSTISPNKLRQKDPEKEPKILKYHQWRKRPNKKLRTIINEEQLHHHTLVLLATTGQSINQSDRKKAGRLSTQLLQ